MNLTVIATSLQTVIETNKLDHLVAVADGDDPVDDSIVAKLASKAATADWSDFVNTTDSMQALRDNMDSVHGITDGLIGALQDLSQAESQAAATAALNAYDPPTRTEATADKDEIIVEVDANEAKIDALPTAAAIADAVLLELIADHSGTSGSLAEFIELIKDISEADTVIDTSDATQWVVIWNKKGTSTEIMRKNMNDINGAAITATSAVVGAHEHTT
jgi:hypothetical protein